MKLILVTMLTLVSSQTFAFTKITLIQNITAVKNKFSEKLLGDAFVREGNADCEVGVSVASNEDSAVVTAGTSFEVDQKSIFSNCGNDWGHYCRVNLRAENREAGSDLYLVCRNKSLFARELTVQSVNKIGRRLIKAE